MAQILFPLFDRVILAPIHTSRATSVDDLMAAAEATGSEAVTVGSVHEAIERAEKDARRWRHRDFRIGVSGGRGAHVADQRPEEPAHERTTQSSALVLSWRTNVWHIPLLTVITVICASISLLISFADKRGRLQHKIAQRWARALVWTSGCSLKINGEENLHKSSGGRVCIKSHLVHGYTGDLCGASISVPHSG